MSEYVQRLFEAYRVAAKHGDDLLDKVAAEQRGLTAEEREALERMREDLTSRKAEIERVQQFSQLATASDAFRANAAPIVERAGHRNADTMSLRQLFLATLDRGHIGLTMPTRVGPNVYDVRALQTQGGSAVETSFADFVTVYERSMTPMLRPDVVGLQDVADGSPRVFPRVTADPAAGGTITAEAAGITELDLTASQVTLAPYKYAITNLYSSELASDSAIDLESTIGFTTARELALDIGTALTTGDGTDDPNGFITAATNGGTASGTGATYGTHFGPTDLVSLFYALAAPYRERAVWQMNATSLAAVRNARDTAGNHIWEPSFRVGEPESILGRPVYENPAMASGSAAKSIAVGDFSRYIIVRTPIRVETSIHYKFNTDQIALRTIERVDGDLVDTAAVRFLVGAAA